uniref:Beta-defensin-like domain-containing protein n=1 Tax=Salvator merianae TaxID=96440 RepID=A0A8D0BAT6_SALMN
RKLVCPLGTFFFLTLLLHFVPGNGGYPAADTLECRRSRGFCKLLECPPRTSPTGGTCQDGSLICCKSITVIPASS